MPEVIVEGVSVPKDATVSNRPDLFGVRNQFRPDGNGGIISRIQDDRPEYATPDASGVTGPAFYVGDRGLPWHVALSKQLGETPLMQDAGNLLNTEAALAAAGSFEVGLEEVQTKSGLTIPGKWATVRKDTGAPLGVVGRGYKVFQEKALAELGDYIVDQGAHMRPVYETGGHMREGAWFFLSMELKGLDIIVPGDPSDLQTYLLLMTSHDGSKPAGYFVTQVRTVCRNTADLAQKGALRTYRIRHTGSLDGKVIEARKALGIALRSVETVKELTNRLALTKIVDSQLRDILEKTWPVKADDSEDATEKVSRHVERTFELYETSPNLEGIRGTAWGAYNAVTEYLDHGVTYHGRARQDDSDARADSLLFGTGHDAKERALKAALALAK
jgi:phage/plasmid-like protein (TIGR03299 family)